MFDIKRMILCFCMHKMVTIVLLGGIIIAVVSYVIANNPSEQMSDIEIPVLETASDIADLAPPPRPAEAPLSDFFSVESGGTSPTAVAPLPVNGDYTDYSDALLEQVLTDGKRVVLFFYAAWCPTCRLADESIQNELSAIPADTVILKVDYGSEKDLRSAYDVAYQHTFVQIAQDKSLVTKFQGASTASAILAQLQ